METRQGIGIFYWSGCEYSYWLTTHLSHRNTVSFETCPSFWGCTLTLILITRMTSNFLLSGISYFRILLFPLLSVSSVLSISSCYLLWTGEGNHQCAFLFLFLIFVEHSCFTMWCSLCCTAKGIRYVQIHISPPLRISFLFRSSQSTRVEFLVLYSQFSLVIYFIHPGIFLIRPLLIDLVNRVMGALFLNIISYCSFWLHLVNILLHAHLSKHSFIICLSISGISLRWGPLFSSGVSLVAQLVKKLPARKETQI